MARAGFAARFLKPCAVAALMLLLAACGGGGAPPASPPEFTMQPTEQSVTAGAIATFTSAVSGVPTPALQWQQSAASGGSWADIAGATAANYTRVVASADNGRRYRVVATSSAGRAVSDAVALYVTPSTAGLVCTGPGGSGWCRISPVQPNMLKAVTKVEASTLVAVGEAGTILRSVDGGLTWVVVPSGTSVALNGVAFAGAGLGLAVGESGTILRSADGGLTWTAAASGTGLPLAAVAFAGSESAAFAVGSDSVFRSTDGGQAWSLVSICLPGPACSSFYEFTGIAFVDASTGVAVSKSGRAIRSTDGGATWTDAAMKNYGVMQDVAFAGPGFGVAVGGGCAPILATSTDAGRSWDLKSEEGIVILCPPRGYLAISLPTARTGFVVGTPFEAILRTTDGGASWAPTAPSGTQDTLMGVAFINPTSGVAVGDRGAILLTRTGGL